MKDFAKVSSLGKINILGVGIGDDIENVKTILSKSNFKISEETFSDLNFVRLSIVAEEQNGLPKLSILFDFKFRAIDNVQKRRLKAIVIKEYNYVEKSEYDRCLNYFKSILKNFVVVTKGCDRIEFNNDLYNVLICKLSKKNSEGGCFYLRIVGNIDKICRLSVDSETSTNMDGCLKGRKIKVEKILKIVWIILVLILAYLFVLNDRYYITQKSYFDKWTKTMYYLDIDEGKWDVVTKE